MGRAIGWIVVVLLFAGLVGVLLRGGATRNAREDLARRRADYERDRATLALVSNDRPALVELALPGNAWDDAIVLAAAADEAFPWSPESPDEAPSPAASAVFLAASSDAGARLRTLARMPCRAPRITGAEDPLPFRYPLFVRLSEVVVAAAEHESASGRGGESCELAVGLAVVGSDFQRVGGIGFAVGSMLRIRACLSIRSTLSSHRLDAETSLDASRVLDAVDASDVSLEDALRSERVLLRGSTLGIADRDVRVRSVADAWAERRWYWSPEVQAVRTFERQDRGLESIEGLLSLPPGDRHSRARTLLTSMQGPGGSYDLDDPYAGYDGSGLAVIVALYDVRRMHTMLARVGLAIAAHVARHGSAPASLEALVPAHIEAVPFCPLSGQPLQYSASPCRVWSVGGDGDDDGGRALPDPYDVEGDGDVVCAIRTAP